MATYVNNLRLTELATGEGSGTWGTTTNTSLELIGEALGYNTQDCFSSDADATTTVADGATDPARAFYFKVTSSATLTATRTLTIAPNTISRVMFIENATTGSQSIAISQGSGANVTIATGKTAVVYLDGAGATAAVVDAMANVDPGVTDTLAEVLVAGNTSGGTGLTMSSGDDLTLTGASYNVVWDSSDSALEFADNAKAIFGTGGDLEIYHNASNSYIDDAGTGGLVIRSSQVNIGKYTGETAAVFTADGSVQLRYDNSAKFETTSTGVDITGNVVSDGATIAGTLELDSNNFDHTAATPQYNMIESDVTGKNTQLLQSTGLFRVRTVDDSLANPVERLRIDHDTGDISFFGSVAGQRALHWDSSADALGIGTVSPSTALEVVGTVTADGLTVDGDAQVSSSVPVLKFMQSDGTDQNAQLRLNANSFYINQLDDDGSTNRPIALFNVGTGDISFYEDTGTTAKLTWDASAESLNFADSSKAVFGAGSDLQIYHDASNSYISESGTGNLIMGAGAALLVKNAALSENLLTAYQNGAVTLYYDNSAKLATTSTGIDVTGDVSIGDGSASATRLLMGTGNDSKMFHNGVDTYWVNDTGNIIIRNQSDDKDIILQTDDGAGGTTTYITVDGSETDVSLHYGGSQKLATTSTGVDVTGTVTADGLTLDGTAEISGSSPKIFLSETDTTDVNTRIRNATGNLQIQTVDNSDSNPVTRLQIDHSTGDISFYEDTGTTAKLFWDASAESLGIGTDAPGSLLELEATGSTVFDGTATDGQAADGTTLAIQNLSDTNDTFSQILFRNRNTSKAVSRIASLTDSTGTEMAFVVENNGSPAEVLRIEKTGNVGIANSSPSYPLDFPTDQTGLAIRVGDDNVDSYMSFSNPRAFFGYDVSANSVAVQGGSGKGITFNVNSGTFGNGEAARIDSSGNFLVGNTDTDPATNNVNGVSIKGQGQVISSVNGATAIFNRRVSDGDIIRLLKGGSDVGSIGSHLSRIHLSADDAGLFLDGGGTPAIWPWKSTATTSGDADAEITLGDTSNRFKDLYLSGGVYVGGTGSANLLDDYEEGTWTPEYEAATAFTSVTYDAARYGKYTKVGNLVHIQGILRTDAINGGSGTVTLTGLPFTVAASEFSSISVGYVSSFADDHPAGIYVLGGGTSASIRYRTTANGGLNNSLAVGDLNTGGNSNYLVFSGTYITTA